MVIRMLKDIRGRINVLSENLNKQMVNILENIEIIKKNQWETKNTISEVKNILEGLGWCGSVDWVPACVPKGHWFNS